MAHSTINEINNELQDCENMSQVMKYIVNKEDFLFTFDDYMNYINKRFNPEIDLSFMKYFMELCDKEDEFIIDHTKLYDYGIITNINTTNNILKCLNKNNLIVNQDYLIDLQILQELQHKSGLKHKKVYKLTPDAFKTCLMNSRNTSKYREYYLFLEKCVRCFNIYNNIKIEKDRELERIMHEEEMMKKDNKIGKLTKKNLSLEEKMDKMMSDNDKERIKNDKERIKNEVKINELLNKSNEVLDINKTISNKLDVTNHKLDVAVIDRVPKTTNQSKLNK
jgi:hypothetical protein